MWSEDETPYLDSLSTEALEKLHHDLQEDLADSAGEEVPSLKEAIEVVQDRLKRRAERTEAFEEVEKSDGEEYAK